MTASALAELVDERSILVCCGPGGVGKTTTAAALALEGARRGRRSVVVTIDPARRLADALGLASLSDTPSLVEGDWPGELWALMLDTESTFDALVAKYAPGPEQAEAILNNRFYRNISGALSGTQEYMAMEKLHELHDEDRFDLVVVDTPPTRNALDFVDAPRRLTRLLDNRIFRLLMLPTRASIKAVNVAAQAFLRTVARVVGAEVVQDAVRFFQAFEGMEDGFRDRAQRVLRLLSDPGTAFVLVAAPRPDVVAEAEFFADKLGDAEIPVAALVVNRMHPRYGREWSGTAGERARTLAGTPLGPLYENLAELHQLADGEEEHVVDLVARLGPAPAVRVPVLPSDVHDLDGLAAVAAHLSGSSDDEPVAVG
ncbi:MAG TPA: ArsA-related P-loop ATPase [Acidimicrobiales bacterium]|nr:ArsA-related P-loop ATPase [Acidimicrobiales bacterium]